MSRQSKGSKSKGNSAGRPSIREVAKLADVSIATVSRAFNDPDRVRQETRQRVLRVAEVLGYVPDANARSLLKGQTFTLGLMIPTVMNCFYAELARSVETEAGKRGYQTFLCNTYDDPEREESYLRSLVERRVDGIICAVARHGNVGLLTSFPSGTPMVLVNRWVESLEMDAVVLDNEKATYEATKHLLGHGYTRIAHIAGPEGIPTSEARLAGYRQALEEAGIPLDPALVVRGPFSRESGHRAVRTLLDKGETFEAIFAQSDDMAIGAIACLRDLGYRIPEDVAIMGFDNTELGALGVIGLSAVSQDIGLMGQTALELLMERLEGKRTAPRRIVLQPSLILRRSCGH